MPGITVEENMAGSGLLGYLDHCIAMEVDQPRLCGGRLSYGPPPPARIQPSA